MGGKYLLMGIISADAVTYLGCQNRFIAVLIPVNEYRVLPRVHLFSDRFER